MFASAALAQEESLSLSELRSDLERVDEKLEETKFRIQEIKDVRFLADLYFMLAEFYVSKSRYEYLIKVKENEGTPIDELDFTIERKPKLKAIETYQSILDRFPKLGYGDRALFYMAHEMRELGDFDQMISTYTRLTAEFPKSEYYPESKIILGDYEFNTQKNVRKALKHFNDVLKGKVGPFSGLASYRAGWCYVNLNEFKSAFFAFENVLIKYGKLDYKSLPQLYQKTDIRVEALNSIVWPYSELKYKELLKMGKDRHRVIKYFKMLSPNLPAYLTVLGKLARRLKIKKRNVFSTRVYFELLRLSPDLDTRVSTIPELYRTFRLSRKDWPIYGFVREIAKTVGQAKFSAVYTDEEKKKILLDFEIFARDIATRLQKQARSSGKEYDYLMTVAAYQSYLKVFSDSKFAPKIRLNLAESFFNLKDYINAGKEYERLERLTRKKALKKSIISSSIEAYTLALKTSLNLNRLELDEARNGLRKAGIKFISKFKKDSASPGIILNLAQTYYDERLFDKAQKTFLTFIKLYPKHKSLEVAINLLLDTYQQQDDIEGLISQARRLLKKGNLTDRRIRQSIQTIIQQGEIRKVQDASVDSADYGANLLKLAKKYKGSEVGDKALFEAFTTFKAKKDERVYEVGEKLLANHSNSKYAKEVVSQLGQVSLLTADFRRASVYFEYFYNKYPNESEARDLLNTAAKFRMSLGDYKFAARNFKLLGDSESIARADFLAQDWSALQRSAARIPGIKGEFWKGLSLHRLLRSRQATPILTSVTKGSASDQEEKGMIAHSLYLISLNTLREYEGVQIRRGNEATAVNRKAALLDELTQNFQKVIGYGDGTWTVAALYSLGVTYKEFANFIGNSPIPKGFPKSQIKLYKNELKKQSKKYTDAANKYFKRCLDVTLKFEIFTGFTKGCLSKGKIKVEERNALPPPAKAQEKSLKTAKSVRRKLLDQPRNISTLYELIKTHNKARDYQMSLAILDRVLEIDEKKESQVLADKGVILMSLKNFSSAADFFKRAIKKSSKNSTAFWGMAALYNHFGLKKQSKSYAAKARKLGKNLRITNVYLKRVL